MMASACMQVFAQVSYSISTAHGRSMFNTSKQYPWTEPGFLRWHPNLHACVLSLRCSCQMSARCSNGGLCNADYGPSLLALLLLPAQRLTWRCSLAALTSP